MMPRITERQKAIARARRLFRFFVRLVALRGDASSEDDDDSSSGSYSSGSSSEFQSLLAWSFGRLRRKENNRYEVRMP